MRTTTASELQLITLGGLDIRLFGQPAPKLMSRKVEALLIYLAANPYSHPREVLSETFWNNQPQDRSLTYLRTALANLNKHFPSFLDITRQTIRIKSDSAYWLDLTKLHSALNTADQWIGRHQRFSVSAATALIESLSQYRGRFLQGVSLRDAPGIEDWIASENTRLNTRLLQAYRRLGEYALAHAASNMGVLHLQRALELDPLDEESHRLLMRLYYQSGNRSAAIAQYEGCRRLLETELNIALSPETHSIYQEICAQKAIQLIAKPIINTLPLPATPFVERVGVLTALAGLINNPECRLLTLTGLGGVGKTRLAIEMARHYETQYTDGVLYASLVPLSFDDEIANLLINALKLPRYENRSPEQGLFQYLQEKHLLLVLDNFEHSPDSALLLSRLLAGSPHLKIIVTARQRLNLQEEWVFHVLPFSLPAAGEPHAAESEALQLFMQSARRVDFDYALELEWATRICQLVEGLPLAIELAASWVRVLSGEKIAREIAGNIDFLSSPAHNVEPRHRSIRAVFNSSWKMFDPIEQEVFRHLSVFRGGFTEAAARYVANAELSTLLSLVDKSVLQAAEGHYTVHELLRQYAYEWLVDEPAVLDTALDRHARYYADLFERYGDLLVDDPQDPIYIEVMSESQNYTLAWKRLTARNEVSTASRLLKPFFKLFDAQNRYVEGELFFRNAVSWLEGQDISVDPLIVARAKILQALLGGIVNLYREADQIAHEVLPIFIERHVEWDMQIAYRCLAGSAYARGQFQDARHYFEKAKTLLESLHEPVVLAAILLRLSDIAAVFGEYTRAVRYLDEYLHDSRRPTFKIIYLRFLATLGDLHIKLGNFAEAETHLLEAQRLCQVADNRISQSVVNSALGRVRIAQKRYTEAIQLFEQSVQLCEALKHDWGKAFALVYMGQVKLLQNDAQSALQHLHHAHEIAVRLNAHWVSAMAKRYICNAYVLLNRFPEAETELRSALEEANQLNVMPVTLEVLHSQAMLEAAQGHAEQARKTASLIIDHPLSEYSTRHAASQLLNKLNEQLNHQ
ncbi:MAG: AfsR/SARP family transcriptional regulator [Aggregatilineales bacterium]